MGLEEKSATEASAAACCTPSKGAAASCEAGKFDTSAPADAATDQTRYKGLLSYIVSNAIAGEIMAVENYGEMLQVINDTDEKMVTAKQVYDESKHIALLAKLGDRAGFRTKKVIVEPQWKTIRSGFSEAVRNQDLISCYLMQDLMTETLAIVLYKTLGRNTDAATRDTATNILKDELHHLDIGIERIKRMLDADPDKVHDRLVWSHNKVVPELFSMISYSCHSLCGELDVECSTLGLDSIKTDLDAVHAEAAETYVETLERCQFAPKVTMPLIANIP